MVFEQRLEEDEELSHNDVRGRAFHAEERAVQMLWECAWHVPRTAWRSVWLKQSKGGG